LLEKILTCTPEFNELQLIVFKGSLEYMFMQEKKRLGGKKELMFGGDEALFAKVEGAYKEIYIELNELLQEKYLMEAEDKITEEVRRRIQAIKSDSTPTIVKKQGTEEINRKLNEKITGSTN
jgi:hypothetical protein